MDHDMYCFICGAPNNEAGNCTDETCPRYVKEEVTTNNNDAAK